MERNAQYKVRRDQGAGARPDGLSARTAKAGREGMAEWNSEVVQPMVVPGLGSTVILTEAERFLEFANAALSVIFALRGALENIVLSPERGFILVGQMVRVTEECPRWVRRGSCGIVDRYDALGLAFVVTSSSGDEVDGFWCEPKYLEVRPFSGDLEKEFALMEYDWSHPSARVRATVERRIQARRVKRRFRTVGGRDRYASAGCELTIWKGGQA